MRSSILGGMLLLLMEGGAAMADAIEFRTWCIGHHHFEVPMILEPVEQYSVLRTMTVDRLGPGGEKDLDRMVRARIAALRAGETEQEGVLILFRDEMREGDVWIVSHVVDTSLLGVPADDWTEEAYVASDGVLFRVTRAMFPEDAEVARAELLTLARSLFPRADHAPVERGAVCLPGAGARVPPTTEAHGVTFAPSDGTRPVGLRVEIVHRAVGDPPLDVSDALPSGLGSRPAQLGDLDGRAFAANGREVGRLLVVGRPNDVGHAGIRIIAEYYDERDDAGAEPYGPEWTETVWNRLLGSFAPKRAVR